MTKTTRAKRKLIPRSLFEEIIKRRDLGVPVARILSDLELTESISRTSALNLLRVYTDNRVCDSMSKYDTVHNSMFPPWLEDNGVIQEQPDNWFYNGYFPHGEWKHD